MTPIRARKGSGSPPDEREPHLQRRRTSSMSGTAGLDLNPAVRLAKDQRTQAGTPPSSGIKTRLAQFGLRGPVGPILGRVHAVGEVTYVSRVRIERLGGPQRLAHLPAETEPVVFGVHSEVAEHYGVDPNRIRPTRPRSTTRRRSWRLTRWHVRRRAGGASDRSRSATLRRRGHRRDRDRGSRARDQARRRALYRLSVSYERREETERVHSFHARFCRVARSLDGAIDITTELQLI